MMGSMLCPTIYIYILYQTLETIRWHPTVHWLLPFAGKVFFFFDESFAGKVN
jgi:hypothetical protein